MWNETDLRPASFRGVPLLIEDVKDGRKKSNVFYEYPFRDDPEVMDMGNGLTFTVRAHFLEGNYATGYPKFLEAVDAVGPGEFIHPILGSFQAQVETADVTNDDRAYSAEILVTFRKTAGTASFSIGAGSTSAEWNQPSPATKGISPEEADKQIKMHQAAAMTSVADAIDGALAPYIASVKSVQAQVANATGTFKGAVNAATAPFKLISSAVAFTASLPGQFLGSVAGAVESVAGSHTALVTAPGLFAASLKNGTEALAKSMGMTSASGFVGNVPSGSVSPGSPQHTAALALYAGFTTTIACAASGAALTELVLDENAEAGVPTTLAATGGSAQTPPRSGVLTKDEIEKLASDARATINAAIQSVQTAFPKTGAATVLALKAQALVVQQTADSARLRRERLVKYVVPGETSLHLLAFSLYGDISRADRLLRVNNIPDPNFIRTGEVLNVYVAR
ncbi:MAG: DNA circularization N-terminal domain-containing protein [Proteobacteria bacterium]|nr:DNA circularization N-terminal domain-containing protein [Pseudomonadota bacterium]